MAHFHKGDTMDKVADGIRKLARNFDREYQAGHRSSTIDLSDIIRLLMDVADLVDEAASEE